MFWHDNFPKSVFLVKNSMFGVINSKKIGIFVHNFGPLTLDPFIKKIKIAAKAQPGCTGGVLGSMLAYRAKLTCVTKN